MSTSVNVTDAMVHAFEDAYCKNWEAQRHAPEGTKELGTFFATRAGLSAALSAQPSPGGQDAARYERLFLSAVEMLTKISLRLGLEPNSDGVEPMLAAIDALASRQPVCAAVKHSLTVGGGQPVGKPVAYLDLGAGGYMDVGTDLSNEELEALPKGRHMLGIIGTYGVDGYKPAQAVDLGSAIKAAFPLLTDYGLHHSHCCEYKLIDERHRLHSLIDSQAVGNG